MMQKILRPLSFSVIFLSSALYAAPNSSNASPNAKDQGNIQVKIQQEGSSSDQYRISEQDSQIMREIQDKLRGSFKGYSINIHVMNGVVTLSGTVKTPQDKAHIEHDIKDIQGVNKVINNLEVTNQVPRMNDQPNKAR